MNRPDQDNNPTVDDDEQDVGGHLGNPANLESGAPVVEDLDDDDPDDKPASTS